MTSLIDDADRVTPAANSHSPPRRSYGPLAAALAAALGAAGIGLAAWSVYESTRPVPRPRSASDVVRAQGNAPANADDRVAAKPNDMKVQMPGRSGAPNAARRRMMAGDGEFPTFIDNPEFTPVANSDQANALVISVGAAAGEQSAKIPGLTPTPLQTSDQINSSLKRFLGPLTQGEIKDGPTFISSNGGKPPESGTIPGIVEQIAAVLHFCELDTANMKVRRAPKLEGPIATMLAGLPAGAVPMMINNNNLGNGTEVSSLTMPLAGLLSGSMEGAAPDAPRVEVTMPAKFKGESFANKKFLLGIVLAQNSKTNTWIPQSLQFHSNDPEAIKELSKMLRPRSAGSDDGAPRPKAPSGRG